MLSQPDIKLELKDSYGMTAVFHACNHGHHRVGDQHGYFRRLWSWDLSQQQLDQMENLARENALQILKTLIRHGADVFQVCVNRTKPFENNQKLCSVVVCSKARYQVCTGTGVVLVKQ